MSTWIRRIALNADVPHPISRGRWFGRAFCLAFLLHAASAGAQETQKTWSTIDAPAGPYLTESAVQDAIRANLLPGVRESRPLNYHVARQTILRDRTIYHYELSPEPIVIGPWEYVGGHTTLEQAVAAERRYYDKLSTDAGCSPYTTIALEPWRSLGGGIEGSPSHEEAPYTVTYQVWDFGTTCKPTTKRDTLTAILRSRLIDCPNKMALSWDENQKVCTGKISTAFDHRKTYSGPVLPPAQCGVGNPCDPSSGDKMQPEVDFDLGWISFTRFYHSLTSTPMGGFGNGWTHSHNIRLTIGKDPNSSSETIRYGLIQADGSQTWFSDATHESDDGSGDRLSVGSLILYRRNDILYFEANGRLIRRRFHDGSTMRYDYDEMGRLSSIGYRERNLQFEYDSLGASAPIARIRSAGQVLAAYTYTAGGQVATVTYPGEHRRTYHYEDTRFPRYLTGVTGEDNRRFSWFSYDTKGRVASSTHDGGFDGVHLTYPAQGGSIVTNALGEVTTYGLAASPASGAPRKLSGATDRRGAVSTTYYDEAVDVLRRVDTVTDRKGAQTKHTYTEAPDLGPSLRMAKIETITEAVGTPEQRVTTVGTEVNQNYLLFTRVANRET
ncbi:DUF6531 domain-containing protein [Lysobacter sp. CA199]|uniref:DUF6531 domain-containing protein n=1 Tax=Lysobacter sp. CA199 TaxID=3455608 RepID=UPI003F8D797E